MMNNSKFIYWPFAGRLLPLALLLFLAFSGPVLVSCKKQPAVSAEQQQIEQVKSELQALLNNTSMSIEEKERALARIKSMNITDPEVTSLIAQVEQQIAMAKAEQERLAEQQRQEAEAAAAREREANMPRNRLNNYFGQIAGAGTSAAADAAINQALGMFSSPDADVLIVISQSASGEPDYDEPTTIKKYLQYLKDMNKQAETIESIEFDDNGKIKLLELTKLK